MKKNRGTEKNELAIAVRSVLFGTVGGSLLTALFLVIASYCLVAMKQVPHEAVPAIMIGISALGTFAAGFLTARFSKKRGLPLGAASGLLLFLLFLLAGLVGGTALAWGGAITRMLVMVLGGALGGYAGIRRRR